MTYKKTGGTKMWWNYLPKFKDQKVKDVFFIWGEIGWRAEARAGKMSMQSIRSHQHKILMHIYRQSLQQKNCFWRNKNLFEIRYSKLGLQKSYYNCQTKSDKVAVCPLKILTWTMYTLCMVLKSQYCGNWLINYAGCQNVAAKLCICIQ